MVELFLTLAVLMVVLGLMINLSNRVRRESADQVTRKMLAELTSMMAQYQHDNNGQLPPITPLIDADTQTVTEPALQVTARRNNADIFRYLHLGMLANRKTSGDDSGGNDSGTNDSGTNDSGTNDSSGNLGAVASEIRQSASDRAGSDRSGLEDPWGTPIVFMQSQHPSIGMRPGTSAFSSLPALIGSF